MRYNINVNSRPFLLMSQLNLEFSACLNTELLRRKGLKYASIPAPSLLEFHICRHFTKSLIWIEMQMPLGHILRINLQDLIGTSI